jgi:ferritin-like metal-binding protein YciE
MAQGTTLRDLLIDEIRDLYDAERQLVKALPKMAKGATSQELRSLIETHRGETEEQVTRLERAF